MREEGGTQPNVTPVEPTVLLLYTHLSRPVSIIIRLYIMIVNTRLRLLTLASKVGVAWLPIHNLFVYGGNHWTGHMRARYGHVDCHPGCKPVCLSISH